MPTMHMSDIKKGKKTRNTNTNTNTTNTTANTNTNTNMEYLIAGNFVGCVAKAATDRLTD